MDFKKFLTIALKDVRLLFTDRAALMITVLTPLVMTFVMGAAFSGISGRNGPMSHIPVVVVNNDAGALLGTQKVNFGETLTSTLKQVGELFDVQVVPDEATARTRLQQPGAPAAAIIIPANFSQALNPIDPAFGDTKINLNIIRDAGSPVGAEIVVSVVRQIMNGFTNANIAVYAAGQASSNPLFLITQANAIGQDVAAKSGGKDAPVQVTAFNSTDQNKSVEPAQPLNLLQYFAPAMAVFFLNFGMTFGAVSIIEEKENWTLQRLIVSPTRRLTILAGKLGGNYINGILQLTVLILATSLFAPIFGVKTAVWGTNLPALIILVPIVVAGAVGLGTLIAGLAKTRRQASIYASAILSVMGLVGGAFGTSSDGILAKLTVNYWATNAFSTLASTNQLTNVLPNIAALLLIFVVCFGAGVTLFSRRLDI